MRGFGAIWVIVTALAVLPTGAVAADDNAALITGRSVSASGETCDKITPVCAAIGGRLVPYDSECHARADGATSVSFSGCFDEN